MKKGFLIACSLFLGGISFAQNQQNKNIIEADNLSEAQLVDMERTAPKDGWVLIKYKGESYVMNYSNDDYILSLSIKCSQSDQKPGYLIEYSRNYGDKEMGGIDFLSSSKMDFAKVVFYLDGKRFENPFANTNDQHFSNFYQALKTAKTLKIDVFEREVDIETTAKQELKLNRSIAFKLANGALLDTPVKCR